MTNKFKPIENIALHRYIGVETNAMAFNRIIDTCKNGFMTIHAQCVDKVTDNLDISTGMKRLAFKTTEIIYPAGARTEIIYGYPAFVPVDLTVGQAHMRYAMIFKGKKSP